MCSLYKWVKRGGQSVPSSIYNRSIIKVKEWGKEMAEKGKKLRESIFLSIYRVYNKRV